MTAYYNENDPFAAEWLRNLIAMELIADGEVDERSIADVQPTDLAGFRQCHFFAGISGWSHALRLAGWPDDRHVFTGSCPCQPFSVAGKRQGTADKRHLWPEFRRLIAECRPATVFGEQTAGKDGRIWLAGVRADLEKLGYAVGAADLCAAGIGAPHIRQRLFWVADNSRAGLQAPEHEAVLGTERWEEGRADFELCGARGMADAEHPVRGTVNVSRQDGRDGQNGRWEEAYGQLRTCCEVHGLADPDGGIASDGIVQRGGQHRCEPEDGRDGERMAHAASARPIASGIGAEGQTRDEARMRGPEPGCSSGGLADTMPTGRPERRPGTGGGSPPWSGSVFISCTDGKARRVPEPAFQRMVDGLSAGLDGMPPELGWPLAAQKIHGRIGALRGFGNAIVPHLAAEFVEAFMDCRP